MSFFAWAKREHCSTLGCGGLWTSQGWCPAGNKQRLPPHASVSETESGWGELNAFEITLKRGTIRTGSSLAASGACMLSSVALYISRCQRRNAIYHNQRMSSPRDFTSSKIWTRTTRVEFVSSLNNISGEATKEGRPCTDRISKKAEMCAKIAAKKGRVSLFWLSLRAMFSSVAKKIYVYETVKYTFL